MSDGPKEHPTMQMPKVTVPASQIDAVLSEVRAMRGDLSVIREEAQLTNQRVGIIEKRLDNVERRQDDGSMRVRGASETNLKQDAVIGELVNKVDTLSAKTDAQTVILTELRSAAGKLAKNPLVIGFATAAITAATAWLAARGH